jgi:AcrR family transcriptional regulator
MPAADKSIDTRLMKCARKEFLEKGFEKASLRRICREASVTTGALYKRFKGKEELFSALVEGTSEFLFACMKGKESLSRQPQSEEFLVKCWDMSRESMLDWFGVIMEHREPFVMLLRCSSGTKYEHFEHELATSMTESNYRFYEQAYRMGVTKKKITKKDMHILDSAYWRTICEPFIHDYTRKEIVSLTEHICSFMNYYSLLGIDGELIRKYEKKESPGYRAALKEES